MSPKSRNKYFCKTCDYSTSKMSDYNKHLLTSKHQILTNPNEMSPKVAKSIFTCNCGKEYKHTSSLSNHRKKCLFKEENKIINANPDQEFKHMFMQVMEENKELRKTISELVPKVGNNNSNNSNNTINKNKFNINVFLNEKCKDAISMDQFIEQIEVSMKDLLTTKDKGLGVGLSNIIIDNMNKLSLYERPMHCTDKKRETLYVKNDEWEKDDKKAHINELLKKVEKKQMKSIEKWTKKHPNFENNEQLQEEYINLIKSCTSSIDDCKDKAIKKVCNQIHVNVDSSTLIEE